MKVRIRLCSASIGLGIFLFFSYQSYRTTTFHQQPAVIVLTVESLRRDQISQENVPHLLAAAESALVLENYRAVSAWTSANVISLLTGLSPFAHGVHTRGQSVDPELFLPLEQLAAAGYEVAGLQPFMAVDLYSNLGIALPQSNGDPKLWLAERRAENKPFFLWYHYVHTHLPYGSLKEAKQKRPELTTKNPQQRQRLALVRSQAAIHAGEAQFLPEDIGYIHAAQQENIREFDEWFAEFWQFFNGTGLVRDTILVVTADHGDEHGERGMVGHASTTQAGHLHRELVDLPCFIWIPKKLRKTKEKTITRATSHLDIMPTVFDLLNVTPQTAFTGTSIFTPRKEPGEWLAMTSSGGFSEPDPEHIRYFEYGFSDGPWKSRLRIFADGKESFFLYNLADDPGETDNMAGSSPEIEASHRKILEKHIQQKVIRPVVTADAEIASADGTQGPVWVRPASSDTICYDSLGDNFRLEWRGDDDATYLLEYRAGYGPKAIDGTLTVDGTAKDFGRIDRDYWQKWIVPLSPFKIRVRKIDDGNWSPWIRLDVRP